MKYKIGLFDTSLQVHLPRLGIIHFRLLVGKNRKPVKDVRASFRPGTLQPNASIAGQVKFIAPRTGSQLWIEFTDPKRAKPLLIDLGRTGTTPDNAFDGFHKH